MTDGLSTPKLSLSVIVPVPPSYPHESLLQDKLWFWDRDSGALGGAQRWMGGQLVVGVIR